MSNPFHFLHKNKLPLFLFLLLNLCSYQLLQAQLIDKIRKTVDDAGGLMVSVARLADVTKRTAAEFNKNVTVVKGNERNTSTNPPPDKVTPPKFKKDNFTNFTWEPVAYFDGQLFPSSIISMSTYKGEITPIIEAISRPIGFRLSSRNENIPLRWEIECVEKKYFDKVGGNVLYEGAGRETYLMPVIPWNYEALAKQMTSAPVGVYFRLFDDEGNKAEKLVSLSLRSINDCIYFYKDLNLQFMFAAYVQEEHPEIDKILRAGINTKMINEWIGYQNEKYEKDERFTKVDLQVATIWRVLHDKGFVYSSITTTTGDEGNVHSQAVRTFDNALKTSQANCVDGTVVFASILRKIGIHPFMVLVPGHCFLGYAIDKEKTKIHFLETTMLSDDQYLSKAKTTSEKTTAYIKEFLAAQGYAEEEFMKNKQSNTITSLIDVSEDRKLIKPIPVYN